MPARPWSFGPAGSLLRATPCRKALLSAKPPFTRRGQRIALVTDIDWMIHAIHLFGWMATGETKTFSLDQREEAIAWVAG